MKLDNMMLLKTNMSESNIKIGKSTVTVDQLSYLIAQAEQKYAPVKSKKKNKETCPCAVKLTTKKKSAEMIKKGVVVYLREEDINGKSKSIAYKKCSQPRYKDSDACWKHTQNSDTSIHFQHDLIDCIGDGVREAKLTDEFFKDASAKSSKKLSSIGLAKKPKLSIHVTDDIREMIRKATEKKNNSNCLSALLNSGR